jgi:hypothetical protein
MASSSARVAAVFFTFCFAVLAFVFVLLGITSHKWAARDYYDSAVPEDWTTPNFTLYRNPFSICTVTANTRITTDDQGISHSVLQSYDHTCYNYKPFGIDRTSCELPSTLKKYLKIPDTLSNRTATRGDARLCQQIHYAGNFGISGTLFVSLGSLMAMGLALLAAFKEFSGSEASSHSATGNWITRRRKKGHADESVDETARRVTGRNHTRDRHVLVAHINLTTISFLCIGAILTLLSQFYGVIGLIQSAPNNSDFASSAYGTSSAEDPNVAGFHGPWYQSPGLSVYMTCGWAFALVTATVAARTWHTPRWMIDH